MQKQEATMLERLVTVISQLPEQEQEKLLFYGEGMAAMAQYRLCELANGTGRPMERE